MNLIQYIASYGDLLPPSKLESKAGSTKQRAKVIKHLLYTYTYPKPVYMWSALLEYGTFSLL